MKRWRHMEQFEQIAERQPWWVGDLISKVMAKALEDAGLVVKDRDGYYGLTDEGKRLMSMWSKVIPNDPEARMRKALGGGVVSVGRKR